MEKETIGHYRIVRLLGAGGMGRVYLAEDLKLGRGVALKILPDEFARDESRMRRFVREAKAALERLRSEKRLETVPGATHLFEEPGALEEVARLAREWFLGYVLTNQTRTSAGLFDHLVGAGEQCRSGLIQHSTHSFLRLWTNATTSRCSASGTWNFAKVAAA